jgi:hypothetical protein
MEIQSYIQMGNMPTTIGDPKDINVSTGKKCSAPNNNTDTAPMVNNNAHSTKKQRQLMSKKLTQRIAPTISAASKTTYVFFPSLFCIFLEVKLC